MNQLNVSPFDISLCTGTYVVSPGNNKDVEHCGASIVEISEIFATKSAVFYETEHLSCWSVCELLGCNAYHRLFVMLIAV